MYDIPIIVTQPGQIKLKYAKDANGKPLTITYDPTLRSDYPKAAKVARGLEQRAIQPWENNLGRPLTLAEFNSGSVARPPRSKADEIARQSPQPPKVDANPAQTHLNYLLRNPGHTAAEKESRKREIKRMKDLAAEFDERNKARAESETLDRLSTFPPDSKMAKAKTHAETVLTTLKRNPRATQDQVDQAEARLKRLDTELDSKAYWIEFNLFNASWDARLQAEVKSKADQAAAIAAEALQIEESNELPTKRKNEAARNDDELE
jgi:hypothetical protein